LYYYRYVPANFLSKPPNSILVNIIVKNALSLSFHYSYGKVMLKTMKLPKKQKLRNKHLGIAVIILAVLLLGVAIWYLWLRPNATTADSGKRPTNTVNYGPPTQAEQQVGDQQKQQIVDQQKQQSSPQPTAPSIVIIRTFQDPTGLNLRTQVTGATSGECDITITMNGQPTVTKTFPVVFDATSANCQNTPIPTSEFSAAGTWTVHITVKTANAQSTPATQNVDIKK
jgi:hypothetical protein